MANSFADYLAEAARRAEARGDRALVSAIASIPAIACNDPVTYRALVRPVADRIAATDSEWVTKSGPAAILEQLDKP